MKMYSLKKTKNLLHLFSIFDGYANLMFNSPNLFIIMALNMPNFPLFALQLINHHG